jgi:hypothetical protein
MGVLLVPSGVGRERVLAYGSEGAGKTFAAFSIMNKVSGRAFYLDTDDTVIPFLDGERFHHLQERVTFTTPYEFGEALEQVEKWRAEATADDWLVIDRADWLWDAAQAEFSDKVFGTDIDEHLMQHRMALEEARAKAAKSNQKAPKAGNPFEGFTDWPIIKKRHQRIMRAAMTFPGHVYLVTAEKKVDEKLDDPDILRSYGRVGARPAGEKNNGYLVRTVIRFQGNNPQTWRITTVKDREREYLDGVGVKDFALDYLVRIGGWKVKAG